MEESVHKSVAGSIVGFRLLLWGVVQGNANFANGANCSNLGCFYFLFFAGQKGTSVEEAPITVINVNTSLSGLFGAAPS